MRFQYLVQELDERVVGEKQASCCPSETKQQSTTSFLTTSDRQKEKLETMTTYINQTARNSASEYGPNDKIRTPVHGLCGRRCRRTSILVSVGGVDAQVFR